MRNVQQQAKLLALCLIRKCRIWLNRLTISTGHLESLYPGFCIVVFVPPSHNEEAAFPIRLWTPGMAAAMDAHSNVAIEQFDDVSFSQIQSEGRITTCKPSPHGPDEDRGLPVMIPGTNAAPPQRPYHDGAESWIEPLGSLFQTQGVYNAWDDELTLPVLTWYVNHAVRPACRRARTISLSQHPIMWIDELRHA